MFLDIVRDSFTPDEGLKGTDMREDIYRKACQREGIDKVLTQASIFAGEERE